jgi:hypothetical protein
VNDAQDDDQAAQDLAKARFTVIIVSQLSGFALLFFGVSVLVKHWIEPSKPVGVMICALAVLDLLFLPLFLLRRWRARPPAP